MLLAADRVLRHTDTVQVVVSALVAAAGTEHRRIAAGIGAPVDTVRR